MSGFSFIRDLSNLTAVLLFRYNMKCDLLLEVPELPYQYHIPQHGIMAHTKRGVEKNLKNKRKEKKTGGLPLHGMSITVPVTC